MLLYIIVAGVRRTEGFAAAWNIFLMTLFVCCFRRFLPGRLLFGCRRRWLLCSSPWKWIQVDSSPNFCFIFSFFFLDLLLLTWYWPQLVCPVGLSCNATIAFLHPQPWASFFRFPVQSAKQISEQKRHRISDGRRAQPNFLRSWWCWCVWCSDRVINTCQSSALAPGEKLSSCCCYCCCYCCCLCWRHFLTPICPRT